MAETSLDAYRSFSTVDLQKKEVEVLAEFIETPGLTITREQLAQRLGWKEAAVCGRANSLVSKKVLEEVEGGGNEIDNLITSCEACNLGKGAISLTSVPMSLAERAALVAEQEAQILGYQAVLEAKRDRIEEELWRVAEVIEPGSSEKGMLRDWTASIRRFNERLGVHAVLEFAEIARTKYHQGGKRTFLYFCGICWNHIREDEGEQW